MPSARRRVTIRIHGDTFRIGDLETPPRGRHENLRRAEGRPPRRAFGVPKGRAPAQNLRRAEGSATRAEPSACRRLSLTTRRWPVSVARLLSELRTTLA